MRARHLPRRFTWRKVFSALAALVVFFAWFLMLRPTMFGGPATYSIVSGHSMEPTFEPGDYVVAHAQDDYAEGDIVMFQVPGGVVIHRIVGGGAETGFITRGDNNAVVDPWQPAPESILGEAWVHVPGLGNLIAIVRGPIGIGVMAWVLTTMTVLRLSAPRGRHLAPTPASQSRRSFGGARARRRARHHTPANRTAGEASWVQASRRPGRL